MRMSASFIPPTSRNGAVREKVRCFKFNLESGGEASATTRTALVLSTVYLIKYVVIGALIRFA